MLSELEIPFDRVTWRDGQLLTARDFNDDHHRDDRLRRLHLLYLHGAASGNWGIVVGFDVTAKLNDTFVTVHAGYGVDGQGQELLLANDLRIDVPSAQSGNLVLTASWRADSGYAKPLTLTGVCECCGLNLRWEQPVFAWKPPAKVSVGEEIPLGRFDIGGGRVLAIGPGGARRYMRALKGQRTATDITPAGNTNWTDMSNSAG